MSRWKKKTPKVIVGENFMGFTPMAFCHWVGIFSDNFLCAAATLYQSVFALYFLHITYNTLKLNEEYFSYFFRHHHKSKLWVQMIEQHVNIETDKDFIISNVLEVKNQMQVMLSFRLDEDFFLMYRLLFGRTNQRSNSWSSQYLQFYDNSSSLISW